MQTQITKGSDYPFSQSEVQANGFYMQQILTGCLSEYAYFVESQGEALIIDPMRDTEAYESLAKERKSTIKYILLTHFHADFVAGHHELRRKTGATILMGPNSDAQYVDRQLQDGEEIQLGSVKVRFIHTPGHTMESTSFLLIDSEGKPNSLFTGDTLFLGEVGRPDLAVKGNSLTEADLAGYLYRSLREKIMSLPDDVQIYPGHGAGSACGKNISAGFTCTIGKQKASNYALQDMTQEEFIKVVTNDIPPPPKYFFHNVSMNKQNDIEDLTSVIQRASNKLSVEDFKRLQVEQNAQILDSRSTIDDGYIKGSINISQKGQLSTWVGQLLSAQVPLLIVTDVGNEVQTILRLSRVGFDNVLGYLDGGFENWKKSEPFIVPKIVENDWVAESFQNPNNVYLDIRNRGEWQSGILKGAQMIQLAELQQSLNQLDKSKQYSVYCRSGQRAKMAATILLNNDFQVYLCRGGFDHFKADPKLQDLIVKP